MAEELGWGVMVGDMGGGERKEDRGYRRGGRRGGKGWGLPREGLPRVYQNMGEDLGSGVYIKRMPRGFMKREWFGVS